MIISLIAAMDCNNLIGSNNQLPWHLPADFAWFKSVTMGKPVIMGRKTWDSIGRPLPGRTNVVISRNSDVSLQGATCVSSLQAALDVDRASEEQMVIGGSSIYDMAMPLVSRMYITHVDAVFEGDAWFPQIGPEWHKTESQHRAADEKNAYDCEFAVYEKM